MGEIIKYQELPVVTTELLAKALGTGAKNIQRNFQRNKARYQQGVHYFELRGKALSDYATNCRQVDVSKRTPELYLWTEKGCLNHVKSLGTDEAWDAYQNLVDTYFRQRQALQAIRDAADQPTVRVLTPTEALLQSVQLLAEQEKRIEQVESKVAELEARTGQEPGWFTIMGYAKLHKQWVSVHDAARLGGKAKRLCQQRGIVIQKIPDPRFGEVGLYPTSVLSEVFAAA